MIDNNKLSAIEYSIAKENLQQQVFEKGGVFLQNQDIRSSAKEKGVKLWQIAQRLNITDGNFSRRLRRELSQEEKAQVFEIIEGILQDGGENNAKKDAD